jgi:hypothetical protein
MRSLIAVLALTLAAPAPALAQQAGETWTAVIDRGMFSGDFYTWRLKKDGAYEEDGRDIRTGASIQQMVTGTWSAKGQRLVLRQDSLGFVFDGVVNGSQYSGTFYQDDTPLAKFCAWKGKQIPTGCGEELVG